MIYKSQFLQFSLYIYTLPEARLLTEGWKYGGICFELLGVDGCCWCQKLIGRFLRVLAIVVADRQAMLDM